jgi:predicted phosphate transport protein (TIGR00153 family)
MLNLSTLFGKSPFEPMVEHARKVHACVALIRPVAEAILANDLEKLKELQHQVSKTEYEADLLKDHIRQGLPPRYFLPVDREDMGRFLSQVDKIADDAEDFAVVATFRQLNIPESLRAPFLEFVDKVVHISESLLGVAELLGDLQKEAFVGTEADGVLLRIQEVCHMEWECDKLSRKFAREYYSTEGMDTVTIILLEKLCRSLSGIADHAENVGKNLRLMILRK